VFAVLAALAALDEALTRAKLYFAAAGWTLGIQ
jgi:hypothetical protein